MTTMIMAMMMVMVVFYFSLNKLFADMVVNVIVDSYDVTRGLDAPYEGELAAALFAPIDRYAVDGDCPLH